MGVREDRVWDVCQGCSSKASLNCTAAFTRSVGSADNACKVIVAHQASVHHLHVLTLAQTQLCTCTLTIGTSYFRHGENRIAKPLVLPAPELRCTKVPHVGQEVKHDCRTQRYILVHTLCSSYCTEVRAVFPLARDKICTSEIPNESSPILHG